MHRLLHNSIEEKLKYIEETIRYNFNRLYFHFIDFGIKYNILKYVDNILEEDKIPEIPNIQNKIFLIKYINTLKKLISYDELKLRRIILEYNSNYIVPDYLQFYDEIIRMFNYFIISERHPLILYDFEYGADFVDFILSSNFSNLYREVIAEYLNIDGNSNILDVGCGSYSPVFFGKYVFPNGWYVGIDKSRAMIKIAENRIKRNKISNVILKNIPIEEIIVKERYDYVICTKVLEYIESMSTALNNMMRCLKRGGKLVIFSEIFPDLIDFNEVIYEFFNSLNKSFIKYRTTTEIINALENMGFSFDYEILGKNFLIIEKL